MPIEIPYTFIAGTKAKAKEVNDNFNAIAIFVDQLEVSNAELESLVNQISATKAELNGDSGNRFQVADALGNFDAINKRTLTNLTLNSRDCISGFVIAKQSNTSINCTPGACWDSTYTAMISSTTSLVKSQSNLQANGKYYVYVTSDKETGNCELVISLSNATPELPTGFEYFRQLGYFTTDSNGYIQSVHNTSQANLTNVISFPDYNNPSGRSLGTSYTATQDGWVSLSIRVNPNATATYEANFSINGTVVLKDNTWKYADCAFGMFPISKGDTYILSGSRVDILIYNFYPCKTIGGN